MIESDVLWGRRRDIPPRPQRHGSRSGLPAGPRRHSSRGRHRDHGVPRRAVPDEWRLLLARHVLRPFRIPDHDPARRRVATLGVHTAGPLLGPPGAPAFARAVSHGPRRGGLRRALHAAGHLSGTARRRHRVVVLRRQLALHRGGLQLLRADGRHVTAPAHLVPRRRGAVLPALAADRARDPSHTPRPAFPFGDVHRGVHRLGCGHGDPVFAGVPEPRLLRDRHAGAVPAHWRGLVGRPDVPGQREGGRAHGAGHEHPAGLAGPHEVDDHRDDRRRLRGDRRQRGPVDVGHRQRCLCVPRRVPLGCSGDVVRAGQRRRGSALT